MKFGYLTIEVPDETNDRCYVVAVPWTVEHESSDGTTPSTTDVTLGDIHIRKTVEFCPLDGSVARTLTAVGSIDFTRRAAELFERMADVVRQMAIEASAEEPELPNFREEVQRC